MKIRLVAVSLAALGLAACAPSLAEDVDLANVAPDDGTERRRHPRLNLRDRAHDLDEELQRQRHGRPPQGLPQPRPEASEARQTGQARQDPA